jgi:hypothetical protein
MLEINHFPFKSLEKPCPWFQVWAIPNPIASAPILIAGCAAAIFQILNLEQNLQINVTIVNSIAYGWQFLNTFSTYHD